MDCLHWLKRPAVRQLTPSARGLLFDLVALSIDVGEPHYGFITRYGAALSLKQIAKYLSVERLDCF